MTIDQTIEAAATKFGVDRRAIVRGGFRKGGNITKAREWIVSQHPEMGVGELSRALGFYDHSGIVLMRKRIQSHASTD